MPRTSFLAAVAFAGAITACASLAANAQSASPTPAPAAPAPSPAASATPAPSPTPFKLITLSGFGDVAAQDVEGTKNARFVNGNPSRIFDAATGPFFDLNGGRQIGGPYNFNDQVNVQNLNGQLQLNGALFSGKIEGSFGTDAGVIASNGQTRNGTNITQAYLQVTPSGALTFTLGKFETLAGAEVIESPGNTNFSRSYLFGEAIPFTHTGVRAAYAVNSKVTVTVGVNNGWDDWKFVDKKKTIEGGLSINPSPGYSLVLDTYNGNDFAVGGNATAVTGFVTSPPGVFTNRMLYDGVLTLHPTSAITLIANYDNGTQLPDDGTFFPTAAHWNGIAGYANYQYNSLWGISLRKETFHDTEGFRTGLGGFYGAAIPGGVFNPFGGTLAGSGARLQSNTATLSYTPNPNLIFRGEYRLDTSDQPVFEFRNFNTGIGSGIGRTHQPSIGLEAIVKYP